MGNVLHILHHPPSDPFKPLPDKARESLAEALVHSGRLRIDIYERSNYIRFSRPVEEAHAMFSRRELLEEALLPRTRLFISHALSPTTSARNLEQATEDELVRLRQEIGRFPDLEAGEEMAIARLLVQCTEPEVIQLGLTEMLEVFVTADHDASELLDVVSWQTVGHAGGLQLTGSNQVSVLIACGGNPLVRTPRPEEDGVPFYSPYQDGYLALARLLIVGAQEFGHYADIIRNAKGQRISRHSADLALSRPSGRVREARLEDITHLKQLRTGLDRLGFVEAYQAEQRVVLLKERSVRGPVVWYHGFFAGRKARAFLHRCRRNDLWFVDDLSTSRYKVVMLYNAINDMLFNLSPRGECYFSTDRNVAEAVLCAEALARMPQQAMKWGHDTTKAMCPHLYRVYYKEVIPTCRAAVENLSLMDYGEEENKEKGGFFSRVLGKK